MALLKNKTKNQLFCLVMAGGSGTRFWPASTESKPKQYLSLTSDRSLIVETLERFHNLVPPSNRFVVTIKEQENLAKSQAQGFISPSNIILEPLARNTAPCILLSLAQLLKAKANLKDVVIIVPADHVILNTKGFQSTIEKAALLAQQNHKIVTIGIPPTFPHTGYGYIEKGSPIHFQNPQTESASNSLAFSVSSFKEKPNREKAIEYVATGNYLWNAGMFVTTLETLLKEFQLHAPLIHQAFPLLQKELENFSELTKIYAEIPKESIDYAVMEKSQNASVIPAEFDWNDLGSWDALESVCEKIDGNILLSAEGGSSSSPSQHPHYFENAEGNIISSNHKFLALINVHDLIIVNSERGLVILPKKDAQKIKDIVDYLKTQDFGPELL